MAASSSSSSALPLQDPSQHDSSQQDDFCGIAAMDFGNDTDDDHADATASEPAQNEERRDDPTEKMIADFWKMEFG